jgi:hypothetical protein
MFTATIALGILSVTLLVGHLLDKDVSSCLTACQYFCLKVFDAMINSPTLPFRALIQSTRVCL